jgi:putative FmdB family regulatory protein
MPLYEYQCDACGHRFEKIQKFSDPLVDTCPKCGGVVRKLISSPAIQFKGSGFYITDYAKKDHVAAAKADKEGAGTSEKSEKSETSEKSGKTDKADTAAKTEKSEKTEKSSSSSETSSSSATTPAASTTAAPSTKDSKT